jgi:hypothetical protein
MPPTPQQIRNAYRPTQVRCVRCGEPVDEFSASVRFTGGRLCRHCISDAYCRLIASLEQPCGGESIVGAGDEDDEPQHDYSETPWLLYILAALFGLAIIVCALVMGGVL